MLLLGRTAAVAVALVCAVGGALSGCSDIGSAPGAVQTTTPSRHDVPSTNAPTPSHVPTATRSEFDRNAVYAACDAAVPADVWGGQAPLPPGPIGADTFGLASSDGYTAAHTNGDPDAIYVNVQYFRDDTFAFSALCVASGDPAEPRVEYIRTLD
jgi:hypothetical protein